MPTPMNLFALLLLTTPLWTACQTTSQPSVAFAPAPVAAAESKGSAATSPEEEWQALMRLATPGQHHKMLEPMVGRFKAKTQSWIDATAQPEESFGAMENRWILGGRFLKQEYMGQMMGMPFEGVGLIGFDNARQRFLSTWVDNMGTGIMQGLEGTADKSGKVITASGKMDDPLTLKSTNVREQWTLTSNDEHLFEMWSTDKDGQEFKMLEIRYTRM
jgi:hypothetical protein